MPLSDSATLVIGCRTMENEIRDAMRAANLHCEVRWFEAGLHNTPKKLHTVLQRELDNATAFQTVLLGAGFCGNAVSGLSLQNQTLVIPRVDDCISLLMGSCEVKSRQYKGCYFLTDGWLRGERTIWKEYEYIMEKYGEKTGQELFQMMFGHYNTLAVLDTGCYCVDDVLPETNRIAQALHLKHRILPGNNNWLRELFSGNWTQERFLVVPPKKTLCDADLLLF